MKTTIFHICWICFFVFALFLNLVMGQNNYKKLQNHYKASENKAIKKYTNVQTTTKDYENRQNNLQKTKKNFKKNKNNNNPRKHLEKIL